MLLQHSNIYLRMNKNLKIKNFNIYRVPVGWKDWVFLKISINDEIYGFSDCTDANGSIDGLISVLRKFCSTIVDMNPLETENIRQTLFRSSRQSSGGINSKAISGILNCLIEIKSKLFRLPVYSLYGGPVRKTIDLYWSHCFTTRIRQNHSHGFKAIKNLKDLKDSCELVNKSGYKTVKTNIILSNNDESLTVVSPGFKYSTSEEDSLNSKEKIDNYIRILNIIKENLKENIEIIIDINMHFPKNILKYLFSSLVNFNPKWIEVDSDNWEVIKNLKNQKFPLASCEKKLSLFEFMPFISSGAIDICIIDVRWTGFEESLRIANFCNLFNIKVGLHNSGSNLSTMMAAHLGASITNLNSVEYDVDESSVRENIFKNTLDIEKGKIVLSDAIGWGVEINEEFIAKYAQ